ncbi:MAG: methylenetetrahydrofolate--tRNA-(uracil(54)-C(5))-methyltransferase (FADH(2)-oxidizing) TrmFO [Deltaproteobacteria bacterium]|nr:methylenetetrahydrofolate--tRNA-(uracil(54)-C(5))-methyltransferase (FADH(2)-oxidizing) TrmFO [Deltaproteobacteria bacterium]
MTTSSTSSTETSAATESSDVNAAALSPISRRALEKGRARVIGGGLAGCEAAFQLAERGIDVELFEMKPKKRSPAAITDRLAELVCSNSFRSNAPTNAVGSLKAEMRRFGSLLMLVAEDAKVPAGDALAVNREKFSDGIEAAMKNHPRITLKQEEVTELPMDDVATLIATGPLTADALANSIQEAIKEAHGIDGLSFYDAIAPIIEAESVIVGEGPEDAYFKSRYDKGDGTDYLNCPMSKEAFMTFLDALKKADEVVAKEFEKAAFFEGCLPIEVLASRGEMTLTFGCMKPVGLEHPTTGIRPYAVLQLRKEDVGGTAFNLVGCQTRLKQPDQRTVFRTIPALREVRFQRYGAIHRNTYLDSPKVLDDRLRLRSGKGSDDGRFEHLFFAGQITGVEGYVESTACGLLAAHLMADLLDDSEAPLRMPPEKSLLGGLYRHVLGTNRAHEGRPHEPANIMWSMVPPMEGRVKKKERKEAMRARADEAFTTWLTERNA